MHRIGIVLLVALMASAMPLAAQDPTASSVEAAEPGRISIMYYVSAVTGASESMTGPLWAYRSEVRHGDEHADYPCGEIALPPSTGGVQIAYRLPGSRLGGYVGAEWLRFTATDVEGFAHFDMATVMIGGEYALWEPGRQWSFFGRGGINGSSIGGELVSVDAFSGYRTTVRRGVRLGIDGGLGARYTMRSGHFALETSIGYIDANLIGRSYTPATHIDALEANRELNDGADPGDPDDHSRAIALFTLRLGARLIF